MYHKIVFIFVLFLANLTLQAQEVLTLETCYALAEKNHPLQGKFELLDVQNDLEQAIIATHKLPKFELTGQATYQSDVVHLPISLPNIEIESPNKEQYKASLTASQLLYNGGLISAQQHAKEVDLKVKKQEVLVQLHQIKAQINQLYFSVLLADQTNQVLQKNSQQLEEKIVEIENLVKNGILPENSENPLKLKLLEIQQKKIEIKSNRNQLAHKLGLLIGENISNDSQFSLPKVYITENQNKRPELALFGLQKEMLNANTEILKKNNYPKVSAFGTGGMGNPGLNMLDNSLQEFYIFGAKFQWNVFDWNANKKQQQAIAINKDIINTQKEVFEWQQNITSNFYYAEIEKFNKLKVSDDALISLQRKIVATAEKQLKHDLITTADYTAEINKLLEKEINLKKHEIQMLLSKANYQVTQFE